jgi:hypothetical protein
VQHPAAQIKGIDWPAASLAAIKIRYFSRFQKSSSVMSNCLRIS